MKIDIKKIDKCVDCKNTLKKYHKHHFRCNKCWYEYKSKLALMPIELPFAKESKEVKE